MSIETFILWWLIWTNSLLSAGWHYDLTANRFVPPGAPIPPIPALVVETAAPGRNGRQR